MADISFLSPQKNQCILPTHTEALSRAARGIGDPGEREPSNGQRIHAQDRHHIQECFGHAAGGHGHAKRYRGP